MDFEQFDKDLEKRLKEELIEILKGLKDHGQYSSNNRMLSFLEREGLVVSQFRDIQEYGPISAFYYISQEGSNYLEFLENSKRERIDSPS